MGNRRIGRKRLYAVEKAGKTIDLESGVGIKGAIKSATQHRNGQEIITEIAIDLAPNGVAILGGGGDNGVIGTLTAASQITQLTAAKFGVITEIRAVLLEIPATGCTVVNVTTNVSGTEVQDANMTGDERCAALDAIGKDVSASFTAWTTLRQEGTAHYLYLTAGDGNASAMSAGKLVIYIHGFEAPSDI